MNDNLYYMKRRRVPRRPLNKPVGLLYKGQYSMSDGIEVGERGMLIGSDQLHLSINDLIVVNFFVPGFGCSIARAIVRYQMEVVDDNPGVLRFGLEFENADFNLRRDIRFFVASGGAK